MSKFAHNPETGEAFIWRNNEWQPATPLELEIGRSGAQGQVLSAVVAANPLMGFTEIGQAAMDVNPVASGIGMAAGVGAGLLPSAGRMAGRVASRLAAREARQDGGESALRTAQGFIRQPEEALPEFAQGAGRIVRSGAETLPVTRMITDYLIRNPNQRNLNRLGARALGITDDELKRAGGQLTDDPMGAADARMAERYDIVGKAIGGNANQDEVLAAATRAADEGFITTDEFAALTRQSDEQGRELMGIQSELKRALRTEKNRIERTKLQESINQINKIIDEALEGADPGTMRIYQETNAQYRASLAFERGQSWSNGNINAKSMDSALRNIYGRGYRRGARPDNAPQSVRDFLDGVREAQSVNVGLPTSGTAERMFAASLLGGTIGVNVQ